MQVRPERDYTDQYVEVVVSCFPNVQQSIARREKSQRDAVKEKEASLQ